MLVLCCTSSAITAEWTDKQSQVLSWTGGAPPISVDMWCFVLARNLAHCVWKGWNCFEFLSLMCHRSKKRPALCSKCERTAESACPSFLSPLMKSVIFCDLHCVPFVWYISSSGGQTYKNQIWQIRLIMMQMQNVGHWWACCHKGLPQSCVWCF